VNLSVHHIIAIFLLTLFIVITFVMGLALKNILSDTY